MTRSLLLIVAYAASLAWPQARAAERPLILQGAPAVAARLLDPYREHVTEQADVALIVLPNSPVVGLTALLEGRADVAMLTEDCDADLAAVRAERPVLSADLQIFEIDRRDGHTSSFVTRGTPTPPIRRLIDAARRVAAAHPF